MSKQLLGKHGASQQILLAKVKSVAVRHSELSTVALVNDLHSKVFQLQSINMSIARENQVLIIKHNEATRLVVQVKRKFNKVAVDIDKQTVAKPARLLVMLCKYFCVHRLRKQSISKEINNDNDLKFA